MKRPFDPHMISEFQKGVLFRDVERVKAALKGGVDPATPVEGLHPLMVLLYGIVPAAQAQNQKDLEAGNRHGARIAELLLDHGVRLVEEEKYATQNHRYLTDRLLMSKHLQVVSDVVIHAIKQSLDRKGAAYRPDAERFAVAAAQTQENPGRYGLSITAALDALESVHDVVRARLRDPRTKTEKELVSRHRDQIGYWLRPFERPALKSVLGSLVLSAGEQSLPFPSSGPAEAQAQSQAESATARQMAEFVKALPKKKPQQVLEEISRLIGMDDAKGEARALVLRTQFDAARAANGLKVTRQGLHTVFEGNPGTGKTTMARHRAELLHALGLAGNRYVEISRENMVGEFIGQTEAKMVELFKQADVIFIDEAYNLINDRTDKKDFGVQVVNALMTALENRRETLTVFFAGYPEEMREFLASNPGLQSRITHYQQLPDYTTEELGKIVDQMTAKAGLRMEPEARDYAVEQMKLLKQAMGPRDFGNARIVRTMVEQLPNKMAERLFGHPGAGPGGLLNPGAEELSTIKKSDVEALNLLRSFGPTPAPAKPGIGFHAIAALRT